MTSFFNVVREKVSGQDSGKHTTPAKGSLDPLPLDASECNQGRLLALSGCQLVKKGKSRELVAVRVFSLDSIIASKI